MLIEARGCRIETAETSTTYAMDSTDNVTSASPTAATSDDVIGDPSQPEIDWCAATIPTTEQMFYCKQHVVYAERDDNTDLVTSLGFRFFTL